MENLFYAIFLQSYRFSFNHHIQCAYSQMVYNTQKKSDDGDDDDGKKQSNRFKRAQMECVFPCVFYIKNRQSQPHAKYFFCVYLHIFFIMYISTFLCVFFISSLHQNKLATYSTHLLNMSLFFRNTARCQQLHKSASRHVKQQDKQISSKTGEKKINAQQNTQK